MGAITYRTITTIKETSKATVVLAMMEEYEDPVIVKRLHNANPEVYRMLSNVESRHIPHIYAWEQRGEELIVAEEYADGETLKHYMESGELTEEQKLSVALQLCDAVEVLHGCTPPIIHRDIKPSNILVTEDGIVKLIDFDASRQYKWESDTSDTRVLGTAEYAAPEQYGYMQTDVRSDIYSMGIVFHDLEFRGNVAAVLGWKKVLDICTSFDPKKRYKNVKALARDIRRVSVLQNNLRRYLFGAVCLGILLCAGLWLAMAAKKGDRPVESSAITVTPVPVSTNVLSEPVTQPPTPSPAATAVPTQPPTPSPTATAIPTQSPTPVVTVALTMTPTVTPMITATVVPTLKPETSTPFLEPEREATLDEIENRLEQENLTILHYYKNQAGELLFYTSFFEMATELTRVSLTDYVSKQVIEIPQEYCYLEDAILHIAEEFLLGLENSCYELDVRYDNTGNIPIRGMSVQLRVHALEESFMESGIWLANNYLDYWYGEHEQLHTVVTNDTTARITGLLLDGSAVTKDLYRILYDGRGMELSSELLESCKSQVETVFWVLFSNGKKESLTIVNPYQIRYTE